MSSPTCVGVLRAEMNKLKKLRAPSFRFFLAKGWETSNLNSFVHENLQPAYPSTVRFNCPQAA
jgi:hypothetical protein